MMIIRVTDWSSPRAQGVQLPPVSHDMSVLRLFEDLLNILKRDRTRSTFAPLKHSQPQSNTQDTVGDHQDMILREDLQGSQMGTKEMRYDPPETMQSSLASLDEFEDAEESFSHA